MLGTLTKRYDDGKADIAVVAELDIDLDVKATETALGALATWDIVRGRREAKLTGNGYHFHWREG